MVTQRGNRYDSIHQKNLPGTFVIAGNVGTPEAVRELENAGADATKVGIGPGKVCITKLKPASVLVVGNWLLFAGAQKQLLNLSSLTAVSAIMATSLNPFALVLLWLWIGSLFAGHEESPGEEKSLTAKQ